MNTKLKIKFWSCLLVSLFITACVDHVPNVEELPNPDVAFNYSVVDNEYQLDYYVGANIKFVSTSAREGECTWDFGDNSTPVAGKEVVHRYAVAGTYKAKLTVSGVGSLEQIIYISDIQPILTLNKEDSICEVLTSYVSFDVELPNPEGLEEKYVWLFPEGTMDEEGNVIEKFEGKDPGKIKFGNVGSQAVKLQVTLGGRALEESVKNVQVAYNEDVPTLYYAAKGGNIMALKLVNNKPQGMKISPFDMGVNSGQTPMNILFNDQSLYVLDPGRQFTYVDDSNENMGDGRIFIMSKDGSRVENMLTSSAWAFHDPFYGYIEGTNLYYADRNQGIRKLNLNDRNLLFSSTDSKFDYFVQNSTLGYYGLNYSFGAINAGFGKIPQLVENKIEYVWYWCKTYNGVGIFRFRDSDILPNPINNGEGTPPAVGIALDGMMVKSFAWDSSRQKFYFTILDSGYEGFYACTIEELDLIKSRGDLAKHKKTLANGNTVTPITEPQKGEGSPSEYIGICQLAVDESDGSVYFGLRSADAAVKSGLMRYNLATDKIEHVIEDIAIFGVAVNKTPSKLF